MSGISRFPFQNGAAGMNDRWSRRKWLKTLGAAGAGALMPLEEWPRNSSRSSGDRVGGTEIYQGAISECYSTSDVFIPPRGDSWMKFSFDFPEPAVVFGGIASASWCSPPRTRTACNASMRARGTMMRSCSPATVCVGGGQEESPGQCAWSSRDAGATSSGDRPRRWTARSRA